MSKKILSRATLALALLMPMVSFAGLGGMSRTDARSEAATAMANDVFSIKTVTAGAFSYKIVEMDSGLNGDLNSTIVILVGTEVGGAAGYDEAFQVGPNLLAGLKSVKVKGDRVEITGQAATLDPGLKTLSVKYDAASKQLSVK